MTKSFLQWKGGKAKYVQRLVHYASSVKYTNYTESFAGGASLLFALAPKQATIRDTNQRLNLNL